MTTPLARTRATTEPQTRVLLVEDNPADARLVLEAFNSLPATTVCHVSTLAEARAALRERYDCVLLDLGLPDAAGLEGLWAVLRTDPMAAVVVLTGLDDLEVGERAVIDGAQDYVVKGTVSAERLAGLVRYAVRRRRINDARERRGRILEMVANRSPLSDVLREVAALVEACTDTPVRCLVLVAEPGSPTMHAVSARGADELVAAVDRLPVNRTCACCPSAACRAAAPRAAAIDRVSGRDVATVAGRLGLRTCWSVPVRGTGGPAVGALLVMSGDPTGPTALEVELVRHAAAHAALAIDRERSAERIAHSAMHDPLTDLPNRSLLFERMENALARHDRDNDAVAVLFIDLDGFKNLNDTYGHAIGDEVLVGVCVRLRSCLRPGDTIARYGGDEFVEVVEGMEADGEIDALVERIHSALDAPLPTTVGPLLVTASVGVAVAHERHMRPQTLIDAADVAMYRHKRDPDAVRGYNSAG